MSSAFPTYEIEKELHSADYQTVVGVDEVARGTLWGSVVAAAVYIPPENVPNFPLPVTPLPDNAKKKPA